MNIKNLPSKHSRLMSNSIKALTLITALLISHPALAQLGFTKTFIPNTIGPGSVSTLQFDISNETNAPVTDIAFIDILPVALSIANSNISTTCTLGDSGVLNGPSGGGVISVNNLSIAANTNCQILVDVRNSGAITTHTNLTGDLTSSAGNSGTATDDLEVRDDRPGISMAFSPANVANGSRSTLTYTISNVSNTNDLSSLALSNPLPDGLTIASPSNASSTCGGPNPMLSAESGSSNVNFSSFGILFPGFEVLLAGESCTISVDVIAVGNGTIVNVTEDVIITNPFQASSGKASAELVVTSAPLGITQNFVTDPVAPGSTVTVEYTLTNRSRNDSATDLAFSVDYGAALANLTYDSLLSNDCGGSVNGVGTDNLALASGTLGAGASCTIRASLTVSAGSAPGQTPISTSTVTAMVGGSPTVGDTATDTLFVSSAPVVSIDVVPNVIAPGDEVVFTYTVSSSSATSMATNVSFSNTFPTFLPTGVLTPSSDTCGAGSTVNLNPLVNPPSSDVTPATLNLFGVTLQPAGDVGDSCTFTATFTATQDAPVGSQIIATTTPTAMADGGEQIGLSASTTLTVIAAPTLSKVFTDDPALPGETVTVEYTLSYPEEAVGDATNISFTDDLSTTLSGLTANLPALPDPQCGVGSTFTGSAGDTLLTLMGASLSPGDSCTFSVTLNVPSNAASGSFNSSTSGVSSMVSGLTANSSLATDTLNIGGLIAGMEFIGSPVISGENVTLRFTLDNISPTDEASSISFTNNLALLLPGANNVSIVSTLPLSNACGSGSTLTSSGLFLIFAGGSLAAGESCSFDLELGVPIGVASGSFINTTGNITAIIGGNLSIFDPITSTLDVDNTALSLSKEFTDDPVEPGSMVNLQFTLTNLNSVGSVTDITFTDDLNATLTGLVATGLPFAACGGTVDAVPNAGTIEFSGGSLDPSEQCQFDVTLTVPSSETGVFTNTTSDISGLINGLAVLGTAASDDLVVQAVDLTKAFGEGVVRAGDSTTLSFTINNRSTSALTGLQFTDDLDSVITGLVATGLPQNDICGSGSSISGTSFLQFTAGSLAPDASCTFTVDILVPVTANSGSFTNTSAPLTVQGETISEAAVADIVISPFPPTFSKAFTPATIGVNSISSLVYTINNTVNNVAATALDFTDNLPAGLVIATPSTASTTCTGGTVTAVAGTSAVSYTGGSVSAAASCTVSVDVTSAAAASYASTTGDLTSSSGNSGTATDTLQVLGATFSKLFNDTNPVRAGDTVTLSFTISNQSADNALSSLLFTDELDTVISGLAPVGLPLSDVCGTGSELSLATAALNTASQAVSSVYSGQNTIRLSDGSLPANGSCTFSVNLTVPQTATPGNFTNTTSNLTANSGVVVAQAATDVLTITATPCRQMKYQD